jgi:radical SAM superfamily enzyme YgiQ (UPF0313 family)
MRLALVSAKGPLYRFDGGIWKRSLRYAPLTLTTLAALVPAECDAEIRIFDESVERLPADIGAELVAMTVITGSAKRSYELADRYRAEGRCVVLGGPHVTLAPDDAAPHADAIVIGYAETSWPQCCRDFCAGTLQARYQQTPQHDLSGLPQPRRDLLVGKPFLDALTVEATRGCVHNCDFCVVPSAWGRKPYQRPVGEVIDEIRQAGRRRVFFLDLNLIADPAYAAELFSALIPLDLRWGGLATTLIHKRPQLIDLAARSGCRGLLLGFESLVPETLADSDKGFNTPANYHDCVRQLHAARIAVQGCFAFGIDHDTPAVFDQVADFAIEAQIDLPRFTVVTPFPGTPLYRRLSAEGRLLSNDWDYYDGQHVVFTPRGMSPEELQRGLRRTWQRCYRWPAIAKRLRHRHPEWALLLAANAGYRFYARRLPQDCSHIQSEVACV